MRYFLDNLKSRIVERRPIPWGKTIVIDELVYNKARLDSLDAEIRMARPDWTDAQVEEAKKQEVMEDNFHNRAMDEISNSYTIDFHEDDIRRQFDVLKERIEKMNMEGLTIKINDEELRDHARVFILKQVIYEDLAKLLGIEVTDQSAREFLQNSYRKTGRSVREYLDDPERLAGVRDSLLDSLISDRIKNAFGKVFHLDEKKAQKS